MATQVLVSEVGPRDGLQSIRPIMPLEAKKAWIAAEAAAGVTEIEVGSFVPAIASGVRGSTCSDACSGVMQWRRKYW